MSMDEHGQTHLVELACACDDIENCRTEKYISDVRILIAESDSVRYAIYSGSDPT